MGKTIFTRDNVCRNEKVDPRDQNKHAGRKVAGNDIMRYFPFEGQLKPCYRGVSSQGFVILLGLGQLANLN